MARSRKYEHERTEVSVGKHNGKEEKRWILTSWPRGRKEECWIMLIGDCLFAGMFEDFEKGSLLEADLPLIIAVRRGKFRDVIAHAKSRIPPSVRMIIVHLGANDLAATASGKTTASELRELCTDICRDEENLEEISLCNLSPRVIDKAGEYTKDYIKGFNREVEEFENEITAGRLSDLRLSYIYLGAKNEDLLSVLKDTGFNVASEGRGVVAKCLESLIKFKVNTSRDRGDLPERLIQPADNEKRLIIRQKKGVAVGFYHMPIRQLRLSLERESSEIYPDTDIPEFEDDFKCGKKRRRRPYPAEGFKAFKRSHTDPS